MEIKTKKAVFPKAALLLGVALWAIASPARAGEEAPVSIDDPFATLQGSWVPFGEQAESAKSEESSTGQEGMALSSGDPQVSVPSVAEPPPIHALSLAPLPTIGPELYDREPLEEAKKIDYENSPITLSLQDDAWRDINMITHTGYYNENPIEKSLHYALLPGLSTLDPIPAGSATRRNRAADQSSTPPIKSVREPAESAIEQAAKSEATKNLSPEERAVCDEMSAYKKRQLAAIQSDSKTLAELRAVIAELGAKDKIDIGALNSPRAAMKISETKTTDQAASSSDQTKRQQ